MKRKSDRRGLVELGTASTETKGDIVGTAPEPKGLYFLGLDAD